LAGIKINIFVITPLNESKEKKTAGGKYQGIPQ
jgi:hypothetical protein